MVEVPAKVTCIMCNDDSEIRGTLNVPQAGEIFGISRNVAYDLANKGEFPAKVIRLGRRMVVSRAEVHQLIHPQLQ